MNAIIVIFLLVILGWALYTVVRRNRKGGGCCGEHEETVKQIRVADRNEANYPNELRLTISGMTCDNCARKVENALNALTGVWAKVDIESHQARVLSKVEPDEHVIRKTVSETGYVVTEYCRIYRMEKTGKGASYLTAVCLAVDTLSMSMVRRKI